jgi:hypothetical protein
MEHRRGKATRLDEELDRLAGSPEIARQRPKPPALRLRSDAPELDVTEATRASDALTRLQNSDIGILALRPSDGEAVAVVLPVEQYLTLVASELLHNPRNKIAGTDGEIRPRDELLEASQVTQVDPTDTWPSQR